jgi:hypothetical protein
MAMRRLLEDLAGRGGAADPARLAAQLQFLVESTGAAAVVGRWPAGSDGVRALAGAALAAGAGR